MDITQDMSREQTGISCMLTAITRAFYHFPEDWGCEAACNSTREFVQVGKKADRSEEDEE
jgi:hydroxyethylthiazole kinase-like sugar kinase family protein